MQIVVLIKQTFDTEEKIVIQYGEIKEDGVQYVINPYDEYAIEEALVLREAHGGEVTVVTVGPERSESALRKALAMGADNGVHINDDSLFGDEYKTSVVLAEFLRSQPYDLILAGNQAVDNGSGQVAVRVAELLGIPHISTVTKLEVSGTQVIAHRDAEGDVEVIESSLPILVTAQQGLNEPRYPSLLGIRKANKIPLTVKGAGDLPVTAASKNRVLETFLPAPKSGGRKLEGDAASSVKQLVSLLRSTDKVI